MTWNLAGCGLLRVGMSHTVPVEVGRPTGGYLLLALGTPEEHRSLRLDPGEVHTSCNTYIIHEDILCTLGNKRYYNILISGAPDCMCIGKSLLLYMYLTD